MVFNQNTTKQAAICDLLDDEMSYLRIIIFVTYALYIGIIFWFSLF
jgi:hypothetical protein